MMAKDDDAQRITHGPHRLADRMLFDRLGRPIREVDAMTKRGPAPPTPHRMGKHIILQSDRYGDGWKNAPTRVEIDGGDIQLARHIAHTIQEWNWPGQEEMFYVEGDDWFGLCDCHPPGYAEDGPKEGEK